MRTSEVIIDEIRNKIKIAARRTDKTFKVQDACFVVNKNDFFTLANTLAIRNRWTAELMLAVTGVGLLYWEGLRIQMGK